ncbi:MAG: cytochrome c, partial [Planctomycetaceae bacterium]
MRVPPFLVFFCLAILAIRPTALDAEDAAARGYRLLRTMPLVPPDFDQAVFDRLWTRWPAPLKQQAQQAPLRQRRRMTLDYYGLMPDPDAEDPTQIPALGYVAVKNGGWVMNCLTCHAGRVDGRVIPGLPNTHLDLQTLIEDVRWTKLALLKPPAHLDIISTKLPLSTSRGTTNAVAFGVVLGAYRDKDMVVHL